MKKRMRKLLISSLTLAMLLVNSLNVFAAETSEDQTTNVDVPLGVTSEHTMDVESTPVKPAVEKDNNKTNDNTNKKVDTADKKTTKTEAPKTGDTANIAMNVFVMAICGAAIVTVIFRKRFTRR